jgi:predicted lactoylglutathione lyase
MAKRKIFVNLPVTDLEKSKAYFENMGFSFNKQFTNQEAACMVVSEDIFVMLLTRPNFKQFTKKEISDPAKTAQVILALSANSRDEVDSLVSKGIQFGGRQASHPKEFGFMYGKSFEDLDGHIWEVMWMEPSVIETN